MPIQFADSESNVKHNCHTMILNQLRYTSPMGQKPLDEYIRYLLSERSAAGETAKSIAERAGIAPSKISQIKNGEGIGMKVAAALAKALAHRDLAPFMIEADAWYAANGTKPRLVASEWAREEIGATTEELEAAFRTIGAEADEMSTEMLKGELRATIRMARSQPEAPPESERKPTPYPRRMAAPGHALHDGGAPATAKRRRR
jgi:transcriptional regulator with XRE-family HTH domain